MRPFEHMSRSELEDAMRALEIEIESLKQDVSEAQSRDNGSLAAARHTNAVVTTLLEKTRELGAHKVEITLRDDPQFQS